MKQLTHNVRAYSRLGRRIGTNTERILTQAASRAPNMLLTAHLEVLAAAPNFSPHLLINANPNAQARYSHVKLAAELALKVPNDASDNRCLHYAMAAAQKLEQLRQAMQGGYKIVDISEGTRLENGFGSGVTAGYVRLHTGQRRVHLNFRWFRNLHRVAVQNGMGIGIDDLAVCVLIHEASHKFLRTKDYAYFDNPKFQNLTPQRALNNADSLALFAYLMANPDKLEVGVMQRGGGLPQLWGL